MQRHVAHGVYVFNILEMQGSLDAGGGFWAVRAVVLSSRARFGAGADTALRRPLQCACMHVQPGVPFHGALT